MFDLAPTEMLLLLTVVVVIPAAVIYGLYRVIRKAVADGRRDVKDNDSS